MCGIVGGTSERNILPILVEGLRRLEYRGYDSAGVAFNKNGSIYVTKNKKSLPFEETIKKLGGVDSIIYDTPNDISGGTFRIDNFEFLIPSKNINDIDSEKKRLADELTYIKGFLASVEKKLSNKNFIENAPKQIVLNEKKKVSDAKEKIKILERSLAAL